MLVEDVLADIEPHLEELNSGNVFTKRLKTGYDMYFKYKWPYGLYRHISSNLVLVHT